MRKLSLAAALMLALTAQAATVLTGDRINGVDVISELDVQDLAPGKTYRFYFQGASDGIGQAQYVPVVVHKGAKEGKKLLLNSGNHGDEVTGIRAVQVAMNRIDPNRLSGTVIGISGSNPNAISRVQRNWSMTMDGVETSNFNRVFPGKADGNISEQHGFLMWNKLLKGNVDYALDLHTQSTGTAFPFFIYADYREPAIQRLAELFPADQIKKDPGEKGSFETAMVEAKIPAITLELGNPRIFDKEMVVRVNEGIQNVMIDLGMIEGRIGRTAQSSKAFIANDMKNIRASVGGYAEVFVKVGDMVKKGDKVAVQLNAFGDVIKEYTASADGKVLSVGTDAVREPRALLVRLLVINPDPKCEKGC